MLVVIIFVMLYYAAWRIFEWVDMVRFAITGATGMIGSELVEMLLDQGHDVVAIVNPNSNRLHNIPKSSKLTIIKCDISDYDKIHGLEKCDYFYHLAWKSSNVNERDDVYSQIDNIRFTMDAIRLSKSWGAIKFVGAGSQAEFGPVTEILNNNTNPNPESGYGVAKLSSRYLSELLCKRLNLQFCWTRIVSVFGKNDAKHTLIKYLVTTLLEGNKPILTKCEQVWDYLYSKDAADALIRVGLYGKDSKVYLIGSGSSRQLKNYVLSVRDIVNPGCEIGFGEKDYYPHQPMFLSVDISELEKDTGFKPKYSFEEGIMDMVDSIKNEIQCSKNES